jgi:hypothetical protein
MGSDNKKTNWFVKHKLLSALGVFIIIGVIASSGNSQTATKISEGSSDDQTTSATKEQTVFRVGDLISFDGKKLTVISAERNWNSGNEYIVPQSGNEFVKVQVLIENNSNNQISYNMFEWKMQDSQGVIKDISANTLIADGNLGSGNLAANGKVSGSLIFEVTNGGNGLVLHYNPSFWLDKKLEIQL